MSKLTKDGSRQKFVVCFFLRKLKYGGNIFFLEVIYFTMENKNQINNFFFNIKGGM